MKKLTYNGVQVLWRGMEQRRVRRVLF